MGDPLSDPRAADLLSSDPGEVSSLAGTFHMVASQAQSAISGLQGASGQADWEGQAADAFRHQLGKLPGDLAKVSQSYGETANALDSYGGQLGPLRSQFKALANQITSTQSSLSTAQSNLSTANSNLSNAKSAPHAKPSSLAVQNAQTAAQSANGAVTNLQSDLSGLDASAYRILDEFDAIRSQARSRVNSAAGIAPSESWWDSAMNAVGNFMSGVGHFFEQMGKSVLDAFTSLPSDILTAIEHPGDLQDWSKLMGDLGTVAGVVALAAAAILCPFDLPAVAVALSAAEIGGTTAMATKTAMDTTLAAEGKGNWTTVASDAASIAAEEVHVPGFKAADASATTAENASQGLEAYATQRASGATASQAYSSLSDEQRTALQSSLQNIQSKQGMSSVPASLNASAQSAGRTARTLDAADRGAHTVFDSGKDAALSSSGQG
ncbi:MAG: putative T7SS-secreted protein [Solirubrobacteraceae bacterium]